MPANPPYFPSREGEIDTWLLNFSTLLTAAPATYGLVAGNAVAVAAEQAAFSAAYALVVNPATRTPVNVAAKNASLASMRLVVLPFATAISGNPAVDPADKTAIGVTVRVTTKTRRSLVGVECVLSAEALRWGCWLVRVQNPATPDSKKMPPGSRGFMVTISLMNAGNTEVEDVEQQLMTKSPTNITIPPAWPSGRVIKLRGSYVGADLNGGAENRSELSNELSGVNPAIP